MTDEQGRVIDCNQGLCDLLGHTREELLNKPVEEFASLEYKNSASQRMARILEGGMPPFESGAARKDGSRVDIEVSAAPIEIEGRNHIIYFLRDTTERKQAEAFRARARRQACIAQLGQLALGETDLSAWFDEGLPHVAEMLDLDKCMVLELLSDGHALQLKSGVGWAEGLAGSALLDTGVHSQAGYTLLADEPVIVENQSEETRFAAPPILTDHGVISGLSVVIPGHERTYGVLSAHSTTERAFNQEDIDFLESVANLFATVIENKRLDDNLRQAQKVTVLRQLASGVAHDFNNSLGVILGYIELLQGRVEDPKSQNALEIVKKAALSGERTIKHLLDYARKRTDRPKGRADLNRVIQDVVEMTRPRWKSEAEMRGITFEMEFEKKRTAHGSAGRNPRSTRPS
ncbi:MAG: PAS domain S-box protein [Nitrospinota bacterium]|nr:PAS domain S-box protein [Nitrospinota bacterium]